MKQIDVWKAPAVIAVRNNNNSLTQNGYRGGGEYLDSIHILELSQNHQPDLLRDLTLFFKNDSKVWGLSNSMN